jgi:RNA polymerase sigma factor for flagellar operon FliA
LDSTTKTQPKNKTAKAAPKPTRKSQALRDVQVEQLWASYRKDPSDEARNRLVEVYQALIKGIVRRFAGRLPRTVDRGDLGTAANMGLMSAIGGFDPERGVRFESYCELRVKGALLDELRAQDWLPRPWRQRMELKKRTIERLSGELGRAPTDDEAATEMGLEPEDYQQYFGRGLPSAPRGSMPGDDGDDDLSQALEAFPDRQSPAPDEHLIQSELLQMVTQRMNDQESRIFYLKYFQFMPMREIGQLTGLSESRVCKIHARLIDRLRNRFRVDQPED